MKTVSKQGWKGKQNQTTPMTFSFRQRSECNGHLSTFKFGHEFDAALNLRQAYLTTQEIKKRFPKFLAINKTSALLEIIIGSVPEKYDWILGLLSIEGSIEPGLEDLEKLRTSDHDLKLEADMLYALIQGFVLQHPEEGMKVIDQIIAKYPENALVLFLGGSLAIKNSQSEKALGMLNKLGSQQNTLPIYYADYLKGEVYLAQGRISQRNNFISMVYQPLQRTEQHQRCDLQNRIVLIG